MQRCDRAEAVAYWFFRLNGCLTTRNFLVHPDTDGPAQTEADIIAYRFGQRRELADANAPMDDHEFFNPADLKSSLYFVEVKHSGECRLNEAWTEPQRKNLQRVLNAIGPVPRERVDEVAEILCQKKSWSDTHMTISMVSVSQSQPECAAFPCLTWDVIVPWIVCRFRKYKNVKADHAQWDRVGKFLFETACSPSDGAVGVARTNRWLMGG